MASEELTPPQQKAADAATSAVRLDINKRVRRGLWVLAVTLLVAGGLMCYLMGTVLRVAGAATDPERKDFLAKLAVICLLTVLWDFILLVWVAWRIIACRLRPARHGPTPYVNAWALAGERFQERKPSNDADNEGDKDRPGWRGQS